MKLSILIVGIVMVGGCAAPAPSLEQGPNAETTFDGLNRIVNSTFRDAWADPEADWARYDKILPGGAFFEFRAVKKKSGTTYSRLSSIDNEFWIDDASKKKLQEEVSAVFDDELAKSSRFKVTDQAGPDVLIIRGGLHDIVSRTPPEYVGRSEIYLRSFGEATLILEAVDSMSGEVLARAVERRSLERPGGEGALANAVTTWAEVRRLARGWAIKLRNGLDALPRE